MNENKSSPWITSIVIVDFEIEKGQVIEKIHPESTQLSDAERNNLAFLAFPDSNSHTSGKASTQFHFNLRTKRQLSQQERHFNCECKQDLRADVSHYWGYVFFRQVKDTSLKRGYFQKSFVLLSRLPFHSFFYELVNRWAPIYFQNGISALEQGYDQILSWPKLAANSSFHLPILGSVFQLFIPAANTNRIQADASTSSTASPSMPEDVTNNNNASTNLIPISITSPPNELDIFGPIHTIIHHIQLMWELVLLGEPIVIIAPSPTDSSLMVQALVNLIAPFEYFPEVRKWKFFCYCLFISTIARVHAINWICFASQVFPYFTIHNLEFRGKFGVLFIFKRKLFIEK
jgi:hypothetical protein